MPLVYITKSGSYCIRSVFFINGFETPPNKAVKILRFTTFDDISSAGVGIAARHVWLQNLPPDKVPGCGPGLDFMMANFPLSEVFQMVFSGSGECAEISWSFAFLSMPAWVIIWLIFLGSYGVWTIHQGRYN